MTILDLNVERLEGRRLLAGDVTATVSNGDLRITGDNSGNDVSVYFEVDFMGQFVARVKGNNGTSVNGGSQISFAPELIDDDVRIDMRGGDDVVHLGGLYGMPGRDDVTIRTGDGNDVVQFALTFASVSDDLRISTGDGDDTIIAERLRVGGSTRINTGGGRDWLHLDSLSAGDNMKVATGGGRDVVYMFGAELGGRTTISTGGGDDLILSGGNEFTEFGRLRGDGGSDAWLDRSVGQSEFAVGSRVTSIESELVANIVELQDAFDAVISDYEYAEEYYAV